MAKKKKHRRKSTKRKVVRIRRAKYTRRKRGGYKMHCKCKSKRRAGSYAKHTAAMWRSHRAEFKRIGIGRAAKIIAKAWAKKK